MARTQGGNAHMESFTLSLYNQQFRIALRDASCKTRTTLSGTTSPAADTWYHVAAVYGGGSLKIFTNGQLQNSTSLSGGVCDAQADFRIGAAASTNYMNGLLDECALFNTALTDQQICEICRFGLNGQHADRGAACGNCTAF